MTDAVTHERFNLHASVRLAARLIHLPPAVGAKVKVTGKYGFSFSKSSTGLISDPVNGVITYEKIDVVEPPPEKASFKNPPCAANVCTKTLISSA